MWLKHRRTRLAIVGLLVLLVLIAVAGIYIGWQWWWYYAQQRIISVLQSQGVEVHVMMRQDMQPDHWLEKVRPPQIEEVDLTLQGYLPDLSLVTRLDAVSALELAKLALTTEDAKHLAKLKELRYLNLEAVQVQEQAWSYIQGLDNLEMVFLADMHVGREAICSLLQLPSLRAVSILRSKLEWDDAADCARFATGELVEIELHGCQLSDEALAVVAGLPGLTWLRIARCNLSDEDLASLAGLASLEHLFLEGNPITDAGVARLLALPRLKHLGLARTQVTDALCKRIAEAGQPQWLDLSYTAITDEGLRWLAGATFLSALELAGTKITDKGLEFLHSCPHLERLQLANTDTTEEAIAALRAAIPDIRVGK